MLRLAAEDVSFNAAGGNAAGYSVGDLEAVSCHDYPTVWNVAAGIPTRRAQLRHAIAALPADVFAPFSKRVWLNSADESELVRGCLEWPAPTYSDPPFPSASRPHIPVLVIDGEFDQTTPVGMPARWQPRGRTRPTSRWPTPATSAPSTTSSAARAGSCGDS